MSGHTSFDVLRSSMTPERRAANRRAAEDMNRAYVLSQLRKSLGVTQAQMAERLSVAQPTYSAFEKNDNLRIGTLQKIVTALGGVLRLEVVIDGKEYPLEFAGAQKAMA